MAAQKNLRAILGATNTGKTHLAVTRMLAYQSGMIGLPLRLLARELYDRILKGAFGKVHRADVALITGEEKIIPPRPRFYICTVEAMPISVAVDFLAIDEIQLAADYERGHVFTDRLFYARGRQETMLLGAQTMRPMLAKLFPEIRPENRERLSQLNWAGFKKISRLPRRCAVTAFSAEHVYAIGEIIRQQKGGAAVVMGALSPRTRNAQVAMYQAGEVDYLVATDAIGMGLNMDIDHIAFAHLHKFDGRSYRPLHAAELAQIAGRAGRHIRDGTFGVTGEIADLDEDLIMRIENHEFDPVKQIMWRNRHLDFSSLTTLLLSLERPPEQDGLQRTRNADDMRALQILSRDPDIIDKTQTPSQISLLWDIAQIPDFRKTLPAEHAQLIADIFEFISNHDSIPDEWMNTQISHCERTDGDFDTLAGRIAHIRSCTFIANRETWLSDPAHWQARARSVEDKLSDALHQRLTQKFVDRKSALLMRMMRDQDVIEIAVNEQQELSFGGAYLGRIEGLRLHRDPRIKKTIGSQQVKQALEQKAAQLLHQYVQTIITDKDEALSFDPQGHILWRKAHIARIKIGKATLDYLTPTIELDADPCIRGDLRGQLQRHLQDYMRQICREKLAPLFGLKQANGLSPQARGLAFRLLEAGGNLPRHEVADILKVLDQPQRNPLRKLGVRFGAYNVFMPALLKPAAAQYLALSWMCMSAQKPDPAFLNLSLQGLTSAKRGHFAAALYRRIGYFSLDERIIRMDILERLDELLRKNRQADGQYGLTVDMLSILGCNPEELTECLKRLGYKSSTAHADPMQSLWRAKARKYKFHRPISNKRNQQKQKAPPKDSPFAALMQLKNTQRKK